MHIKWPITVFCIFFSISLNAACFSPPASHFPISVIPRRAAVWGRILHQAGGVNDGRVRGDNRQHCPNAIRSLVNNAACHCNNSVSVLRQIRVDKPREKTRKWPVRSLCCSCLLSQTRENRKTFREAMHEWFYSLRVVLVMMQSELTFIIMLKQPE